MQAGEATGASPLQDCCSRRRAGVRAEAIGFLAVKLDEQLAAKFADSDSAEVRLYVARSLHHAIWIHIEQRDHARAVTAATQIKEILCHPLEASELIQATELLLSSADMLSARSVWRRAPAELRAQAQSMIDSVQMANQTGGEMRAVKSRGVV